MIQKFIPMDILSGNKFTNQWSKGSKYFYKNYRDKWFKILGYYFSQKERPTEKMYGKIIRIIPKRKRFFDHANFVHGCKPIPDYLKKAGYIYDDSPKWWDCRYSQISIKDSDQWILCGRTKNDSGTIIILGRKIEWPNIV